MKDRRMRFNTRFFLGVLLAILVFSAAAIQAQVTVFGHRGARGLMPENSIPAMKTALDHGAVLELDVSFSRDKQAIVSHDPMLNPDHTLDSAGAPVLKKLPFYEMEYASIRKYDSGTKQHPQFPKQRAFKTYIPLLSELIDSVEHYAAEKKYSAPRFLIETKTSIARDDKLQPAPEEFMKLLMRIIDSKGIKNRIMIQSFDPRTLEIVNRDYPELKTVLLTTKGTLQENLSKLTFRPNYYCPSPDLITEETTRECRRLGIEVLGGNVNDRAEIDRIIKLGVKGFITDYPDILR